MSSLVGRLARPEILALSSGNVIAGTASDYDPNAIRLHLNENPHPPSVDAPDGLEANRYAEPGVPALRQRMAQIYGVESDNLIVTRGADDAIDILVRSFCRSGCRCNCNL